VVMSFLIAFLRLKHRRKSSLWNDAPEKQLILQPMTSLCLLMNNII
jgi:hypothetical protein